MNHDLQATTDPVLIAELHVRELAEQGKAYSTEEVVEKWRSIPARQFIVAGACGFIAFQERDAFTCYMSDLYVDPHYRGQGLGRALVNAVKGGHRCVELHVAQDNAAARALYRSEGFIEAHSEGRAESQVFMKYTAAQQADPADRASRGH
jgi:ribosomal protein S18 acetylase RimI-like enzyme